MNASGARVALIQACVGLRASDDSSNLDAMRDIAYFVIGQLAAHRGETVRSLSGEIERCLRDGDHEVLELVVVGLLEDLGNISSHEDVSVGSEEVRVVLGPLARASWDRLDRYWRAVADSRDQIRDYVRSSGHARSSGLTSEQLRSVKNGALRRLVYADHRLASDGQLSDVADAAVFDAMMGPNLRFEDDWDPPRS